MEDFLEIVRRLRKECPWDREQTVKSLLPEIIEEFYEFSDAVDREDSEEMVEELGDILLGVFMVGIILEERGISFDKVVSRVRKKMINRHPHVFGEEKAETAGEVRKKWEKRKGKGWNVQRSLPALIRSAKIQKLASRKGFDWDNIEGVFEKIAEEIRELKKAENENERREEVGDILFAVAHLGNFLDIDPEIALQKANDKFERRFRKLEESLDDKKIEEFELSELEEKWQELKKDED